MKPSKKCGTCRPITGFKIKGTNMKMNFKGASKNIGAKLMNAGLGYGVALGTDKLVDFIKPDLNSNVKAAGPAIIAVGVAALLPVQAKKMEGALNSAFSIGVYRLLDGLVTPMLGNVNVDWNSLGAPSNQGTTQSMA